MKKTITIIVIVFLILLGGIGYYLYMNSGDQTVDKGSIFNQVKNFFPFGAPIAENNQQPTPDYGTSTNLNNAQPVKIDRMFQISEAPVAGFVAFDVVSTSTEVFFNKEKSTSTNATTSTTTKVTETYVRFIERATGHIFETKISNLEKRRVSNETIPKVYEAYFNSKGTELITRTLSGDNINTEYRKIYSGTSTTLSNPFPFPYNTDLVITRGDSVFYTTKSISGSTGYISSFDNKKPNQVFFTPLREIGASWGGGNTLEIFNKPTSKEAGVSFVVDIKKKTINEGVKNILGLTTNISISDNYSLFNSDIEKLTIAARIVNKDSAFYLPTKTLPEKCVWSKKNPSLTHCAVPSYPEQAGYPESWYKGISSFNDSFWTVNADRGDQNLLYQPSADGKAQPDATFLSLNDKENYLFFINKKDLSLWGLSM